MSPLLLIPLFYFAAVVQLWLSVHLGSLVPDCLVLVAICSFSISTGRRGGLAMAMAGFAVDLNSSWPLGMATAVFFAVGQAMIWLRSRVNLDRFFGNCCQAWIAATAIPLALAVLARCQGVTNLPWRMLIQQSMLIGLSTFMMSIPWLLLANFTGKRRASGMLLVEG
jgi:hypothetical protein